MKTNPQIVIFGAGAIGGTIAAWLAPHHDNLYVLARGATAEALLKEGLTLYQQASPAQKTTTPLKVITDLDDAADADCIIITVKTYSLEAVAQQLKEKIGDKPVIVAIQNGVANQEILPRYFSKVIYGIAAYNAWRDRPDLLGYQKKGPLLLGTAGNNHQEELQQITAILNQGLETVVTNALEDASHSKIILNLVNPLVTLIGHPFRPVSSLDMLQEVLSNVTHEGTQTMRAAGYHEVKMGGMPSWTLFWAGATLPRFLTRGRFRKSFRNMHLSSMAQDIILNKSQQSELEDINGYFIQLADKHNLAVPYNRALYKLAKEHFARTDFTPIDIQDIWQEAQKFKSTKT